MSTLNFARMSVAEIDATIADAIRAKAQKIEDKKAELRQTLNDEARAHGFTLADIVGGMKRKTNGVRGYSRVTYRNPSDPTQTWAGHGRRPLWLDGQLKAGKQLEAFKV